LITGEVKEDQGVGQLLTTLGRETGTLVRQEVQLASSELAAKGSRAVQAIGLAAAGGAILQAGIICLMAGIVLALGLVIPTCLGAVMVGVLVSATGYAIFQSGLRALKRIDPVPHKAVNALQADRPWIPKETSQ
jgi:hypothetical protein